MLPNLQEATQEYWRKLDELEMAYQQGEISIEEVDIQVSILMSELGQKRQVAIRYFWQSCQLWFTQQRETVVGISIVGIISYFWFYGLSHS